MTIKMLQAYTQNYMQYEKENMHHLVNSALAFACQVRFFQFQIVPKSVVVASASKF